jgi:hypothetical protein
MTHPGQSRLTKHNGTEGNPSVPTHNTVQRASNVPLVPAWSHRDHTPCSLERALRAVQERLAAPAPHNGAGHYLSTWNLSRSARLSFRSCMAPPPFSEEWNPYPSDL